MARREFMITVKSGERRDLSREELATFIEVERVRSSDPLADKVREVLITLLHPAVVTYDGFDWWVANKNDPTLSVRGDAPVPSGRGDEIRLTKTRR